MLLDGSGQKNPKLIKEYRKEGYGEDRIMGFLRLNFLCLILQWTFPFYFFGFKLDKAYKKT